MPRYLCKRGFNPIRTTLKIRKICRGLALALQLFQEMEEHEDSKAIVSDEAAARKQQIKNKSDVTVPPPLSLVDRHEIAISTAKGRKNVFSSLTTSHAPSVINIDDNNYKETETETKPPVVKKSKSDSNALRDEGGSFLKITNQLVTGVTGNASDDWGAFWEINKEEALARKEEARLKLQAEKREIIYKEVRHLSDLHRCGTFSDLEFAEKRDALLAKLQNTHMD